MNPITAGPWPTVLKVVFLLLLLVVIWRMGQPLQPRDRGIAPPKVVKRVTLVVGLAIVGICVFREFRAAVLVPPLPAGPVTITTVTASDPQALAERDQVLALVTDASSLVRPVVFENIVQWGSQPTPSLRTLGIGGTREASGPTPLEFGERSISIDAGAPVRLLMSSHIRLSSLTVTKRERATVVFAIRPLRQGDVLGTIPAADVAQRFGETLREHASVNSQSGSALLVTDPLFPLANSLDPAGVLLFVLGIVLIGLFRLSVVRIAATAIVATLLVASLSARLELSVATKDLRFGDVNQQFAAVARLADQGAFPRAAGDALLAAFRETTPPTDPQVRAAIVLAVHGAPSEVAHTAAAQTILDAAKTDPDEAVRAARERCQVVSQS